MFPIITKVSKLLKDICDFSSEIFNKENFWGRKVKSEYKYEWNGSKFLKLGFSKWHSNVLIHKIKAIILLTLPSVMENTKYFWWMFRNHGKKKSNWFDLVVVCWFCAHPNQEKNEILQDCCVVQPSQSLNRRR